MSRIRLYSCILALTFIMAGSAPSRAANFTPIPLRISAPTNIQYRYDETPLSIPFTLSGCPARVTLFIFTKDRPVAPVRNGYLGWHAVSRIDTCVYMSAPRDFPMGTNVIEWSGKNDDENIMEPNDYTFYLWGYDASSPGLTVTNFINPERFAAANIVTVGGDGYSLANPLIFDALPAPSSIIDPARVVRNKWRIGCDPYDPTFVEYTMYATVGEAPRLAPIKEGRYFITESVKADSMTLWKRGWVPNGDAEVVGNWGNRGMMPYPSWRYPHQSPYGGPVSDGGDKLFLPYLWPVGGNRVPEADTGIAYINATDGSLLKNINLPGWSSPPDAVYCPGMIEYRDGMLFAASSTACLVQMIDPAEEEPDFLVRWENGYGDGVWDKTLRPGSFQATWACFGSDAPPNPASISLNAYLFSLFPATGLDGASFGGFAPDGTGFGYFTIPGMENGNVRALHVVDYGSAYDGIYFAGTWAGGDSSGVRYVACDCVKGSLPGYCLYTHNSMVFDPSAGEKLTPGTARYILWDAYGFETARIELSIDHGVTWSTVADSVRAASEIYKWIVPDVRSAECLIRLADASGGSIVMVPSGIFTISGSSGVADDAVTPRPFVTVANRPNPFNPSTVIRYELGMPGRATLAIYTATGQNKKRIDLGMKSRGTHEFLFDGSGLPSGVYLYRIDVGHASAAGKMLLVR